MSAQNYSKMKDEYIKLNHDKGENQLIRINTDTAKTPEKKDIDRNYNQEYRNENTELNEYNRKVFGAKSYYFCVFRINNRKIKDYGQTLAFQKHMERDMQVPNADLERSKYNRILIGSSDIVNDLKKHLYGVKINSNSNLAVELILSGGNGFFDSLAPQEKELWIEQNISFLKENFGSNCIYACLHLTRQPLTFMP